jgi:catechol 2,3-dioxygenase-like lactoylglutathione lyase family enzyme
MSLSTSPVRATIAVADLEAVRPFYEDVLGLERLNDGEHVAIYACGGDSRLQVYASPEHAGRATATLASWSVDDHDAVVDDLRAKGVVFEAVDGLEADPRGVHVFGPHHVAWCKDPEGNVLAIDNGR